MNYHKKIHFFSSNIRMSGKNINFDDIKISKSNFYRNKKLFINRILISKKEPYGKKISFKYFIGYSDHDYIRPLCIKLPQLIGYYKCFESNETIFFKVTDKKLSKRYIKIWGRVSGLINIDFDSEPVFGNNDKYIKTKI